MSKELVGEKNGVKAYVRLQEYSDYNPRTDWDHDTQILFFGAHRVCAFGRDKHVSEFEYRQRLKDKEYYSLEYDVLGRNPGLSLISIYKRNYWRAMGFKGENGHVRKKALEYLESVAREFAMWAEGEVYSYVIEDCRGDELESCYEFIGEDRAKEDALVSLGYWASQVPAETGIPGAVFKVA